LLGQGTSKPIITSEVLTEDGWQLDPLPLPIAVGDHCMALIDPETPIIIGGLYNADEIPTSNTFILKTKDNEWIKGPSLKFARHAHSCSTILE
jgi:hypothetical protein